MRSVRIKNVATYLAAEDVAIDVTGLCRSPWTSSTGLGAVTNSFDTLGIGSLASSASPRCEAL